MEQTLKDDTFDIIQSGFEQLSQLEIVIAPWLVVNRKSERLNKDLETELRKFAHDLSLGDSSSQVLWLISADLDPQFREKAYYETLLSTAAFLSYMRLGTLVITEEMVSVSESLLRNYMTEYGGSALLSVYARVMTYLNCQVLHYYGRVREDIFVSGTWHRSWIDYDLRRELESGMEYGVFQRVYENDNVLIELTPDGEELYKVCQDELEMCGYLKQREQLIRASNFTSMDDYEKIMNRSFFDLQNIRRALSNSGTIQNGMKVLELGCGSGAFTLDSGLYKAAGVNGSIIATDPSLGMLSRAKAKLEHYPDASNLKFRQAQAEDLPFPDNTFDVVTGMLFLHFTDIPSSFQEVYRVLRPGGVFETLYSLDYPKKNDFFMEWFEPIFKMGLSTKDQATMPTEGFVPGIAGDYFQNVHFETQEWIFDFSEIENVIKFMVQAGTLAELNELPWKARSDLFQELIERGYAIKNKYGPKAMQRVQLGQLFRGTVKK